MKIRKIDVAKTLCNLRKILEISNLVVRNCSNVHETDLWGKLYRETDNLITTINKKMDDDYSDIVKRLTRINEFALAGVRYNYRCDDPDNAWMKCANFSKEILDGILMKIMEDENNGKLEMKTEWKQDDLCWEPMTEKDKYEKFWEYKEKGTEIIFFRDDGFGGGDGVFYNRSMNELYLEIDVDGITNMISSNEFSDETIVNIINTLENILDKRRENTK